MPAAAIPIIMAVSAAGGTAYGIYAQHKQQKTLEDQYAQARGDAQAQLGKENDRYNSQMGMAKPGVEKALGYYTTLLNGSRSEMRTATSQPRAAINDTYRGAARGLEHSGVRGGALDTAKSELSRDRAGKVANLTSGVQPMAAEALGNLSTGLMGNANSAGGNGLSLGLLNSAGGRLNGDQDSGVGAFGGLLARLLDRYGDGKSGGGGLLPSRQIGSPMGELPRGGTSGSGMGGY